MKQNYCFNEKSGRLKMKLVKMRTNRFLFFELMLLALVISLFASTSNVANAAEQSSSEKGLNILSNVLSIDLSTCNVTSSLVSQNDAFLGVISRQTVDYAFTFDKSSIQVHTAFVKGNLQMLYILGSENQSLSPIKTSNTSEAARTFLTSYAKQTNNSLYLTLVDLLSQSSVDKNTTVTSKALKLETIIDERSATYTWYYSSDGLDATCKCITLSYQDGAFKSFLDNWEIYNVASTTVNLSEKQAIDLAMAKAKDFALDITNGNTTAKITNFKITGANLTQLYLWNSVDVDKQRGDDVLA
jgi:hypothetical protein